MTEKIFELVRVYNIVKEIAGDDLKRDQLKFIYSIHDKIYNSALKDIYLDDEQNQMTMECTIPELTVFESMIAIMKVNDKKIADIAKKAKLKA